MKKIVYIIVVALLCSTNTFAHFFWIETNPKGIVGQSHEVRVYFGEFGQGVIEKTDGEVFQNAKQFTLWIIDQEGHKTPLKTTANAEYYSASFTPKMNGQYTIILDHKKYKVLDFTKHDYGIFKPQYHSITNVNVGNSMEKKAKQTNVESIEIITHSKSKDQVTLQVLYKGKPLVENEVAVFLKGDWSKKLKTDQKGRITFDTPFAMKYVIEATHEDQISGTYNGDAYQFTWHCAVYTIN